MLLSGLRSDKPESSEHAVVLLRGLAFAIGDLVGSLLHTLPESRA